MCRWNGKYFTTWQNNNFYFHPKSGNSKEICLKKCLSHDGSGKGPDLTLKRVTREKLRQIKDDKKACYREKLKSKNKMGFGTTLNF